VNPWFEGDAPFKFPEVRKDGPTSTNGLTTCNENLYFTRMGNSHVTTVLGATLLSDPSGLTAADVKFNGRYNASISTERCKGNPSSTFGPTI